MQDGGLAADKTTLLLDGRPLRIWRKSSMYHRLHRQRPHHGLLHLQLQQRRRRTASLRRLLLRRRGRRAGSQRLLLQAVTRQEIVGTLATRRLTADAVEQLRRTVEVVGLRVD